MNSGIGKLRLFAEEPSGSAEHATPLPMVVPPLTPDAHLAATRELIRPPTVRHGRRECEPFSGAWFEELELKRYQRHGHWLEHALEFGRHPGESFLLLGCGMGTDAVHYARTGTHVTVACAPHEYPHLVRENFVRHGLDAEFATLTGPQLPFADGAFDVVSWNSLYDTAEPDALRIEEIFRVLKPGGKVIALFPARYDTAFWQSKFLPFARLYWRRPPDPATAPKTSARELRRNFAQFTEHRVAKRHLRRGELPHAWRILPLMVLERVMGRVLVLKAKKSISAARAQLPPASGDMRAAA